VESQRLSYLPQHDVALDLSGIHSLINGRPELKPQLGIRFATMRALVFEHRNTLPTPRGLAHALSMTSVTTSSLPLGTAVTCLSNVLLADSVPSQQCRCPLERKSCIEQESCSTSRSTRLAARRTLSSDLGAMGS